MAAFTLVAGLLATESVVAAPAHNGGLDGLAQVGPVNYSPDFGGFPIWYKDTNGLSLELCLDENDVHCIAGPRQDSTQPVHFPDNFPDEGFWWAGSADMKTGSGGARLVMALEAAFAVGPPAPGDQVAFSRIRLRVDGLPIGTYTVTHPYGTDQYIIDAAAANGTKSINNTRDTGDFSGGGFFDAALTGRTGPFLVWDSDFAILPQGYLADPLVPHTVTGSPYGTNIFRIEGPPGAFFGSADACPGVIDGSCISTDLFSVQAKESVLAGVEVTRVGYSSQAGSGFVDVFARSTPGQILRVAGNGILPTEMVGDGSGRYFARIGFGTTVPTNLSVTNASDNPPTMASISAIADNVHISNAVFDRDLGTMTVTAISSDDAAVLSLVWGGMVATTGVPGSPQTFVVSNMTVPPVDVTVVSDHGGSDDDDVVITGGGVAPIPLAAVAAAVPSGQLAPGDAFVLDGTGSTGLADTYTWTQTAGTLIPPFDTAASVSGASVPGLLAPDLGATGGQLTFSLTVERGGQAATPAVVTIDIAGLASNQVPVADAGADQTFVAPATVIVLDGSASQNASAYSWTQLSGAPVVLAGANTSTPSFLAPPDAAPMTFQLTASNAAGSAIDEVVVSVDVDNLSVTKAQFKGGGKAEWRIDGTSQYCTNTNTITVELMRLSPTGVRTSVGVIATAVATPAAPGCDWQVRVRNTPSAVDGLLGDWIRVTSSFGGIRDNQQFTRG